MLDRMKQVLQMSAKRRLRTFPLIDIHPTAKVNYRGIRFHPNSTLKIGSGSIVEGSLVSERDGASIIIGDNTFIGSSTIAAAQSIEIGDDVLISWGCNIVDHNSHAIGWSNRSSDVREWYAGRKNWEHVPVRPVKIGNKSWIGLNVIVLKGVEIGEGAVVGAGSVVTRNIPAWTVAAGNPARTLREIPRDER